MSCSVTSVTPQDRLGGDGVRQTGRRGDKEPRAAIWRWGLLGLRSTAKKKRSLKEVAIYQADTRNTLRLCWLLLTVAKIFGCAQFKHESMHVSLIYVLAPFFGASEFENRETRSLRGSEKTRRI